MDILTLLGWIFGIAFILISIFLGEDPATGNTTLIFSQIKGFIDPASIMIVLGGTTAALMVSSSIDTIKKIPKHLKIVFFPTKYNPVEYIDQITEFAREARSNGLLALEDKLNETKEPFMKSSLLLVVDSIDPEKLSYLLDSQLENLDDRHSKDIAFYQRAAGFAPAFGMIGTLIGLINLLANLSDQESLPKNMAVALVTTFYGTILANLIFNPIANKLRLRHEEEYLCKLIIAEGVKSIQDGDNPTFIQEKLTKLLNEKMADKVGKSGGSAAASK
ncbi:MAG: motility protein A [Oscillospiraceae bacterium]